MDHSHQTIIEPSKGWQLINVRELLRYKDLFYFLVWKEIKVLYKQTILGLTWAIIRPLFTMVIFSVVFGRLAKMPSDGVPYPIFAFVALIPWTYFSTAMTSSSNSLVGNTNLLTKVYFPRLIIPMTPVLSGLVDFGIAFVMLAGMMAWFRIVPTWNAVFLAVPHASHDMHRIGNRHVAVCAGNSVPGHQIRRTFPCPTSSLRRACRLAGIADSVQLPACLRSLSHGRSD